MKNKLLILIFVSFILTGCVGVGSKGLFGTGVSVALDPRTVGTPVSYTHLRAHETPEHLVCRLLLEKKINKNLSEKLTESDKNIIKKMINKLSTKEIIDILSQIRNVSKKEIYNYCLELKNEK